MYGVSIGYVVKIYFYYSLYVAPWKFKLASCRSNYGKRCGGEDLCLFMLRLSRSPWVSQQDSCRIYFRGWEKRLFA